MIRLRLEQRATTPAWFYLVLPLAAVLATLVLCAGLIVLAGGNVIDAYGKLFLSPVASRFALVETAVKAAPLIFTGLAVAIAFRAKFWNIGGEGQLLVGAMAAAFIGGREGLPGYSLIPLMILAGACAGALWAMLPAVLRTRFKVDEVVVSLLLNFIVFYAMMALLDGVWKDPLSGYPDSPDILDEAMFPTLLPRTRLHLGVLLALLAVPAIYILMRHTTLGFAIRATGENATAAAYAGFPVGRVTLATAALSGAMAGLAGVGEVGGLHYQVMAGISPGYGYTGIVIAMLAGLNPLGVLPAAFFFAVVITGAEAMSRATGIPVYLSDVIQGTSLITMLVALLFTRYRLRLRLAGGVHG